MAEALTQHYGREVPQAIGAMLAAVDPAFPAAAFEAACLYGYDALGLIDRGRHIAAAMRSFLPKDFDAAVAMLLASIPHRPAPRGDDRGIGSFLFLPHATYVMDYGLAHFETAMQAQYVLTQCFTAEFSMRPFLERYPAQTLARLQSWTRDPSEHVRRLVSECTRPRLPWAPRLRALQQDPRPVLALLEALKDDPSPYVRRSVANNLNDIGKDHPALLAATAGRWLVDAGPERQRLVRHALRSALKRGESGALDALGLESTVSAAVHDAAIFPPAPQAGAKVAIAFTLENTGAHAQTVMADFQVHYVKANGKTRPKVFKLKTVTLAPGARVRLEKTLWLREMTTRRHYAGAHRVDALLNGRAVALGSFLLQGA